MSGPRSSSGSPMSPDFSSAPDLTQEERLLIRSFVTSRRDGESGNTRLLFQQIDFDCIWSGEAVFHYCTTRLARIRDLCTDGQLQECLRTKLQILQTAWKEKDSVPSFRPYAGEIDAIRAHQASLERRIPTWHDEAAAEDEPSGLHTPRSEPPIDVSHTPGKPDLSDPTKASPVVLGDSSDGSSGEVRLCPQLFGLLSQLDYASHVDAPRDSHPTSYKP